MFRTVIAVLLMSTFCAGAALPQAPQNAPLLSAQRASVAAGLNYSWRTTPVAGASEPILGRHAEWEAGVFGAYNLTPHLSLVGNTTLGINSRQFRHSVGVRVRLWNGAK